MIQREKFLGKGSEVSVTEALAILAKTFPKFKFQKRQEEKTRFAIYVVGFDSLDEPTFEQMRAIVR